MSTSKTTFDNKGNVLKLKPVNCESLAQEFYWLNVNVNTIINNNNDCKSETLQSSNQNKEGKNTVTLNNKKNTKRRTTVITNSNPLNIEKTQAQNKNNDNEDILFPPVGSNFAIMIPEVGVKICQNFKIKEGSEYFGKLFNKTTVEDYSRILAGSKFSQKLSLINNKMDTQSIGNSQINSLMLFNSVSLKTNNDSALFYLLRSRSLTNPLIVQSKKMNSFSNDENFPFVKSSRFMTIDYDTNIKLNSKSTTSSVKKHLNLKKN